MQWGKGKQLFLIACLLRAGFWLGQNTQSPYPLTETRAASHAAQLRQIVECGVQSEQDDQLARAACAAVLIECHMDREW